MNLTGELRCLGSVDFLFRDVLSRKPWEVPCIECFSKQVGTYSQPTVRTRGSEGQIVSRDLFCFEPKNVGKSSEEWKRDRECNAFLLIPETKDWEKKKCSRIERKTTSILPWNREEVEMRRRKGTLLLPSPIILFFDLFFAQKEEEEQNDSRMQEENEACKRNCKEMEERKTLLFDCLEETSWRTVLEEEQCRTQMRVKFDEQERWEARKRGSESEVCVRGSLETRALMINESLISWFLFRDALCFLIQNKAKWESTTSLPADILLLALHSSF